METAEDRLRLEAAPDGSIPGGVVVTYAGRRLTGADPIKSSCRRLPREVPPQTLLLVVSPLMGYGIPDTASMLPPSSAILLVEIEPALFLLKDHPKSVFPHLLNRNVAYVSSSESALRSADSFIHRLAIRRIETAHLTGGSRLHKEVYRLLEDALQDSIRRFWTNRGTQIALGRRWVANLARNSLAASRPLRELAPRITESVVLIGAGGNLDIHRDWLATLQGGPTLMALDTALPALADARIQPDIVFSMDGQLVNAYDLLPWKWNTTSLIADLSVHPSIPRRFETNRRFFFASRFADCSLFDCPLTEHVPVIPPRGSVAPAAVELLVRHLNVRTIVTVGIDFWYRAPRSHALMSGPDRRMRATMHRLGHIDGYPALYSRPLSTARLRDGQSVRSDAILADHAGQMKHLVHRLQREFPAFRVLTPDANGLDTGASHVAGGVVRESLRSERARSVAPDDSPGHNPPQTGHDAFLRRYGALIDIRRRLQLQEERLAASSMTDGYVLLDAELDFVLLDLAQWPLITLKQEWAQLHRERILRSTRDYRRRFDRTLQIGTVPGSVTPREIP